MSKKLRSIFLFLNSIFCVIFLIKFTASLLLEQQELPTKIEDATTKKTNMSKEDLDGNLFLGNSGISEDYYQHQQSIVNNH